MVDEVKKTVSGENGVRAQLTAAEVALIVAGLEVLRAQTERAIVKETDEVVIEARRRRVAAIRAIVTKELFQ